MLIAGALLVIAAVLAAHTWWDPIRYAIDSAFYRGEMLHLRGLPHDAMIRDIEAHTRWGDLRDPQINATVVNYSEPWYAHRVLLPGLAAMVYPLFGDHALVVISTLGYLVLAPLLYILLRRWFPAGVSTTVSVAVLLFGPIRDNSFQPMTDVLALAFETAALIAAARYLSTRDARWLIGVGTAVLAWSLTRDNYPAIFIAFLIPAVRYRDRALATVLAVAVLASLPNRLIPGVPLVNFLAFNVMDGGSAPFSPTWHYVIQQYPGALLMALKQTQLGIGAQWPMAIVLAAGTAALFAPGVEKDVPVSILRALYLGYLASFLIAPSYSEFRYELVLIPGVAWGLARALNAATERFPRRHLVRQPAP